MSQPPGSDPFERLVAADPVPDDAVPSASLARVHARIEESIAMATSSPSPNRRLAGVALIGVSAVAVGALAVAGLTGLFAGPTATPPVAGGPTPAASEDPAAGGGGMASCLAFDPATLAAQEFAFDGTVTAIDGDRVTFEIATLYAGTGGGTITVTDQSAGISLDGGPEYAVGGRYLVSGNEGLAWACGYSVEWTADDAATWDAAF
jgi:hypothetical protein